MLFQLLDNDGWAQIGCIPGLLPETLTQYFQAADCLHMQMRMTDMICHLCNKHSSQGAGRQENAV